MVIISVNKYNALNNAIVKYCLKNDIINNELLHLISEKDIKILSNLSYNRFNNYYIVSSGSKCYNWLLQFKNK